MLGRDAADAMRPELAGLDVTVVVNPDWQLGMGGSIRAAMAAVPADAAGVVVTLCDQPHVDAAALTTLIEAFTSDRPTRRRPLRRHRRRAGRVPRRPGSTPLRSLDPAAGAKHLLSGDDVVAIDLPAAAVDVDTPDDYRRVGGDDPAAS